MESAENNMKSAEVNKSLSSYPTYTKLTILDYTVNFFPC